MGEYHVQKPIPQRKKALLLSHLVNLTIVVLLMLMDYFKNRYSMRVFIPLNIGPSNSKIHQSNVQALNKIINLMLRHEYICD